MLGLKSMFQFFSYFWARRLLFKRKKSLATLHFTNLFTLLPGRKRNSGKLKMKCDNKS